MKLAAAASTRAVFLSLADKVIRLAHLLVPAETPARPSQHPTYGDIRDELGQIDGCTCEPAIRGQYSGAIVPDCPHHDPHQGDSPHPRPPAAPLGIGECVCATPYPYPLRKGRFDG